MTAYPLTLTVEFEGAGCEAGIWPDQPYGFAVIRIGAAEVGREPMFHGSPRHVGRDDLEQAAAEWLARITREAAGR
jgi:hypothetical protein